MKIMALIFAAAALAACDHSSKSGQPLPELQNGIIGGDAVDPSDALAKHVVAVIGHTQTGQFLCTGVLIAKGKVLTAAHCADGMVQGQILFSTDMDLSYQGALRPITGANVLPKFGATMGRLNDRPDLPANSIKNWGDLSIMSYSGSTPRVYKPTQIADDNAIADGDEVILAGFGVLNGQTMTPSQSLNSVSVRVQKAFYSRSEFTIAQTPDRGACHGDSGGPAFIRRGDDLILVGITSRGFDSVCAKATVYTRVATFLDWIQSVVIDN